MTVDTGHPNSLRTTNHDEESCHHDAMGDRAPTYRDRGVSVQLAAALRATEQWAAAIDRG